MTFRENINSNGHILFWQPEEKYRFNSNKIIGMDLDWTIIKPIRGKIHPIDENDWEFLVKDIELSRIKNKIDDGYKFVIFTNQGGLLNIDKNKSDKKMGLEGFKIRWQNIYEKLCKEHNITSVYLLVSLYDDFNRKPCTGMWDYVVSQLNNDIKVNTDKCLYVGDMAGRKGDYSSTDLLFALNIGIQFQVPEVFYNNNNASKNKTNILIENLYKNPKIFNSKKYMQTFDKNIYDKNRQNTNDIKKLLLNKNHKSYLILFIGSPASGKTTYYEQHFKNINNLVYISNDTFIGTPTKFMKTIENELIRKNSVIVDNTNGTMKTRDKYIKICKLLNDKINTFENKIELIYIKFNTNKEICLHLNSLRSKIFNKCLLYNAQNCKNTVPVVAIHNYWKRFDAPNIEKEKFDRLFEIDYEPKFHNEIEKHEITKKMFELLL